MLSAPVAAMAQSGVCLVCPPGHDCSSGVPQASTDNNRLITIGELGSAKLAIGIKEVNNGYFWTLNGELLRDAAGNPMHINVRGPQGPVGAKGPDGAQGAKGSGGSRGDPKQCSCSC